MFKKLCSSIGIAALLVGVTVIPAHAAIARSTVLGANNGATAGTTTASITNFTVSGTDKVLWVLCGGSEVAVTSPDPAVVWDSAGANQTLTRISVSTGTGDVIFLFRLINPTDGTNKTISVTGLSATTRDACIGFLYTGVDQTTPNDAINVVESASATNISTGTITSPAGDWIIGVGIRDGSTTPGVSGGGNVVVLATGTSGNTAITFVSEDADGADDTIDYTSGGNARWSLLTMNVNAAAGGGGGSTLPTGSLLLLGVGK